MKRWCTRSACLASFVGATILASSASAQVCHRGVVSETTARWETTLAGNAAFVGPLPADVEVERVDGGVLVTGADGVVGIARREGHVGPIRLATRQAVSRGPLVLHPPLVRGPQLVMLGTEDRELVAFTPGSTAPLESYVGYHASRSVDELERRTLDAACRPAESERGARIYLDATSYEDLRGETVLGSDRRGLVLGVTGAVLVAALALGALAYRRLTDRARLEHADAVLDRRFRELEQGMPPEP